MAKVKSCTSRGYSVDIRFIVSRMKKKKKGKKKKKRNKRLKVREREEEKRKTMEINTRP